MLRKRFGIAEKSDHTLEEVGKLFNVTRERIRQIRGQGPAQAPCRSQPTPAFLLRKLIIIAHARQDVLPGMRGLDPKPIPHTHSNE